MLTDKIKSLRESALGRLSTKQRQWALMGAGIVGFGGIMWVLSAIGGHGKRPPPPPPQDPLGISAKVPASPILAGGQSIRPTDVWIATAGKDVDMLKKDREDSRGKLIAQEKANKEMMMRFDELQKKLTDLQRSSAAPVVVPAPAAAASAPLPARDLAAEIKAAAAARAKLPPLPPPPRPGQGATDTSPALANMPYGEPGGYANQSPAASLVRVSMNDGSSNGNGNPVPPSAAAAAAAAMQSKPGAGGPKEGQSHSLDTFLPISFTKAVLLGGLDAPTGGQSQSNPHPVLLRLEDNAVLPNKFRGQVRECFVVGAGYGDLSSERAYIRTERLSCVRNDGTAIEIKIKGSVFGEDGKVGVRGRLISKQGQVLANALIAGVVSGIGSGIQAQYTTQNTTALGTTASTDPKHAYESGIGQGFGKAMDRMASYYISLAEKMFPIIEVDAGRLVDVVLTEGALLDTPLSSETRTSSATRSNSSSYYRGQPARLQTIGASHDD